MIAAKYRLFSPEPKASKFPRCANSEEVAALGGSCLPTIWDLMGRLEDSTNFGSYVVRT